MPVRVKCNIPFAVRTLWRDVDDDRILRVVYSGDGQPYTYLCPIEGHLRFIKRDTADLRRVTDPRYRGEGRFVQVLEDPFSMVEATVRPLEGHKRQSADNWKQISALVRPTGDDARPRYRQLLSRTSRQGLIDEACAKWGVCENTIREKLRRYFQRGMTREAVSSHYPASGRPRGGGNFRPTGTRQRVYRQYSTMPGRPPKNGVLIVRMLPSETLTRILWQGLDLYLTNKEAEWLAELGPADVEAAVVLDADHPDEDPDTSGATTAGGSRLGAGSVKRVAEAGRAHIAKTSRKTRRGRRSRPSYRNVVDVLNLRTRRKREVRDREGHLTELELKDENVITVRQFSYFCQTEPGAYLARESLRIEQGGGALMPKRGHAAQHIQGPGDVYLLDATVADVYLVSMLDRKVVVGRPTVYLCVDLFSRMIVGFWVGFEKASYEAAALALESIVTPKDQLCARYGFFISAADWPCVYMPTAFHLDRGAEFMATEPWNRLAAYGMSVENSRPYTPTWRAVVERRFGCLTVIYQRQMFGVVERDWHTRGARHYPWDAVHTLRSFILQLLRAIHVYHRMPISDDQPPPEMVGAGRSDTPLNRWNWGIENRSGLLTSYTVEEIQLATWHQATGLLTDRGVRWNGAYFASPAAERAYLESTNRKDRHVPILIQPGALQCIWITAQGFQQRGIWAPTNRVAPVEDLSWVEWQVYRDRNHENNRLELAAGETTRIMQMNNARVDAAAEKKMQKALLREAGLKHPVDSNMRDARKREQVVNASIARKTTAGAPADTAPPPVDSQPSARPKHRGSLRDELEAARLSKITDHPPHQH